MAEYQIESYPDYLARKAAEAEAEAGDKPTTKKAKGVEDKAVKAEDDEAK